ncbi:glycosaminoglycan xylosylkinase homolog [Tribolium castaneum]|uniref:Glycosaminoglycan xylosylkinase-like Protein n=1 Tax=Tribolium castaneum TaxID=7070 RepID=D6WR00_TRICA|nr:PREDICTED: glycosaminoglycan xylosylkinase homolog [Tribolium castaneum]EFA06532.1 Glycosaminoglycan xylosylkinase-like Protein [Tribolium castaneum]|eukprot:XP_008195112.1 PREDICTED: glycosaminoglycan xylosylkinase homolog [Tribolium castaneum]
MIRKRKLLSISVTLIVVFIFSTYYLLTTLTSTESEVRSTHEKIYHHLKNLPQLYKTHKPLENDAFDKFTSNVNVVINEDVAKVWQIANSWVSGTKLVDLESPFLGTVLSRLKTAKVVKADLDTRGTQLKFLLTLEGGQNVVFKPKWYDKSRVIEGPVYAGKDRHSSEIVAFYLSVLLNLPLTPCSVERTLSLSRDIVPVATRRLLNTSFEINNRTCIFGKCFYCKREDPICEDENFSLTGAAIFNINAPLKSYRSPWQRTYKKNKKAVWEEEDNYCKFVKEKITKRRILDLVDASVFDFLIQNGDRHHYETLHESVVLIDNGKGFGNPNISHLDVLAPLYQCCMLRSATLKKLLNLAGGQLRKKIETMPDLEKLLISDHLRALEERLMIVFATIEYCKTLKLNKE